MGPRWINVIFGAWLAISPAVLGYENPMARGNDFVVGTAIAITALAGMFVRGVRHINTALGAWLVLVPFIFQYGRTWSAFNDIAIGIAVLLVSIAPTIRGRERPRRRREAFS